MRKTLRPNPAVIFEKRIAAFNCSAPRELSVKFHKGLGVCLASFKCMTGY